MTTSTMDIKVGDRVEVKNKVLGVVMQDVAKLREMGLPEKTLKWVEDQNAQIKALGLDPESWSNVFGTVVSVEENPFIKGGVSVGLSIETGDGSADDGMSYSVESVRKVA